MGLVFYIYGKPDCSWCDRSKTFLEMKGYEYTYFELGKDYTVEDLMKMFPNAKTVPQIRRGEQYIGGYKQLVEQLAMDD